jgi:arsenate reductase (glutaredoxin)
MFLMKHSVFSFIEVIMIVYLYSKCSTCQNALHFLEKNKIKVVVKEIVKTPPTVEELSKMLDFQDGKIGKLLNTSGQLYREMELSKKLQDMPLSEIFVLLSTHGILVKRPFLLGKDFGLTGFKESEWTQKLL